MSRRRWCAAAVVATGLAGVPALVASGPARALSCVGAQVLASAADRAFIGEITGAGGDHVLVEVDEVWRGPDVPELVVLRVARSGFGDPIEDDPLGSPGATWMFAPTGEGDQASLNACSAFTLRAGQVRRLRPEGSRPPVTLTETRRAEVAASVDQRSRGLLVAGAGLVVALGGARWWLVRRPTT